LRKEIEDHAGNKERNGKVDQHNVLRVLRKQCRFDVKGVQVPSSV
jgi:hypothetical protein